MRALTMGPSAEIRTLTLLQTSTINVFLDAHEEALSNLLSVRDEALDRKDFFSAAHAADFLADRALRIDDLKSARMHAAAARKWAQSVGNGYRLDWVLALEGQIEYASGNIDEGLDRLRRARDSFAISGAHGSEMHCAVRLAEALIESKRYVEAANVLARGAELAASHRYNVSRIKLLRLNAILKKRRREIKRADFDQIMRRADILAARSQKAWSSVYRRGQVFSVHDVGKFLATLDSNLFEIVCKQILEFEGFRCRMTPRNHPYLDIIAERVDPASGKVLNWGVSCKRVITGVGIADVPDRDTLLTLDSNALIMMTTGKVSGGAAERLKLLKKKRFPFKTWEDVELCEYLAKHDWILADVGTQLPSKPSKLRKLRS
jgi:hypothetical protein